MSATVYIAAAGSARNMAARRLRIGDGVALPSPDGAGVNFRRVDAAFVLSPPATEVSGMIEALWNSGQIVRVKNSSGSSMAAGTLLARTVSTLTNQTSVTATNSPKAGASVVITMASSTGFEVGNLVSITDYASPNPVDYALVSAVTTGQITVDVLTYDTTTPTVTALPCYSATVATNASAGYADWVISASLANGAYGWAYAAADVSGLDTHTFSVGDFVYLGTAGAFATAPTSSTATSQIVGEVEVSDASVGRIKFFPGQRRVTKYAQGSLRATATNDNAPSGGQGEFVQTLVATGSAVSLTTATPANICNVSLTAGDWDVEGNINFNDTSATLTATEAGISATSATLPTDGSEVYCGVQLTTTTAKNGITLPRKRISIASTTTVYLVGQQTFSAGTAAAFGQISARRVR